MNLIDMIVTKVLNQPIKNTLDDGRDYWSIQVEVESWGVNSTSELTFGTEAEAKAVKPGYTYQG